MMMRRAIAFIAAPLLLPSCAAIVADVASSPGNPPDVRQVVTRWLSFDDRAKVPTAQDLIARPSTWQRAERFELSSATETLHTTGWAWRTCLRVATRDQVTSYAVFVEQNRVVDLRGKVTSDNCEKEQYTELAVRRAPSARDRKSQR